MKDPSWIEIEKVNSQSAFDETKGKIIAQHFIFCCLTILHGFHSCILQNVHEIGGHFVNDV